MSIFPSNHLIKLLLEFRIFDQKLSTISILRRFHCIKNYIESIYFSAFYYVFVVEVRAHLTYILYSWIILVYRNTIRCTHFVDFFFSIFCVTQYILRCNKMPYGIICVCVFCFVWQINGDIQESQFLDVNENFRSIWYMFGLKAAHALA